MNWKKIKTGIAAFILTVILLAVAGFLIAMFIVSPLLLLIPAAAALVIWAIDTLENS